MSIVTAVSAARPAQPTPEYIDPSSFAFARNDWGRSAYASALESASRPSRLAASGMTATETPATTRDDGAAKRRIQVMEEVAVRLARLAETSRRDLAARALESLRQKLKLLKMQAMAAILRDDRKAALMLADELAEVARAIVEAEQDCAAAGNASAIAVGTAVPILGPQTPRKDDAPPVTGEAALDNTPPPPMVLAGEGASDAADVQRSARGVREVAERAELHQLTATLAKRSSPLLPLFDTSDGPDSVASEAATIIRALRRAAHRPRVRRGQVDVGARIDAGAIAASLGNIGLLGMAQPSLS